MLPNKETRSMRSPLGHLTRARSTIVHALRLGIACGLVVALAAGVARGSATASPPANESPPTISGTPQQDQTLTASLGTWSGDSPITYSFQWQRCDSAGATCGSIAGATASTRQVGSGDVGGTLRVVVTATNPSGVGSAASGPTTVIPSPGTAPTPTKQPDPHGSYVVGQTINVDTGTWTGNSPITFTFQWQRCNAGGSGCTDIPGATGQNIVLGAADLGLRLRAIVRGTNSSGTASIASNLTGSIAASSSPVNTLLPAISNAGGLRTGDLAVGSLGSWSGNPPITYSYQWYRCDGAGRNCQVIQGATGTTHRIPSTEAGATLVFTVTAANPGGSTTANSTPAAVIGVNALPAGAIALPDGKTSIPASSVALPQRLVVSQVKFSPSVIRSRNTFTVRFRVTDTRGYVVRDALVYAVGLPYSYVRNTAEQTTGADGYVVINITPTASLPIQRGAIVFFVRARKSGDSLLAGVSTRRLVQVTVSR